jgi:hypothetical protein
VGDNKSFIGVNKKGMPRIPYLKPYTFFALPDFFPVLASLRF